MHRVLVILVAITASVAVFLAVLTFFPTHSSGALQTASSESLPVSDDASQPFRPSQPSPSILFFGDIMLGRNVENMTNKYGGDYLFEKLTDLLTPERFIYANLEGPIVRDHQQTPSGSFSFSFKDTSDDLLAKYHFDIVSLANNHTLNQGKNGFIETQQMLKGVGILYMGHPYDMSSEVATLQTTVEDQPIQFASFNLTFPEDDPDAAVETVAKLQAESDNPIIVTLHWGAEYQLHSNSIQQKLAHRLIDAGADLIIGAHPHVVQEVEGYNGKLIFYSLGNFIFDQYFSVDTQQGLAVGLEMTDDGWMFDLYPLQSKLSQPSLMEGEDKQNFLDALAERSSEGLQEMIKTGKITLTP